MRLSFLLITAEPTIEEWNQIIATAQQHNLTWLNLGDNKIEVIPDSITQLRNVKALWIYSEALRMISVYCA